MNLIPSSWFTSQWRLSFPTMRMHNLKGSVFFLRWRWVKVRASTIYVYDVCMCTHVSAYICAYMQISIYIYIYTYNSTHTHIHTYIYIYIFVNTCKYQIAISAENLCLFTECVPVARHCTGIRPSATWIPSC